MRFNYFIHQNYVTSFFYYYCCCCSYYYHLHFEKTQITIICFQFWFSFYVNINSTNLRKYFWDILKFLSVSHLDGKKFLKFLSSYFCLYQIHLLKKVCSLNVISMVLKHKYFIVSGKCLNSSMFEWVYGYIIFPFLHF